MIMSYLDLPHISEYILTFKLTEFSILSILDYPYLIYIVKKKNMELFRLNEILEELNMSKEYLAQKVGLSRTNMYNYLSSSNTTINVLNKIAEVVRLPVSELFVKEEKQINGYVEFDGYIHKISSEADFRVVIDYFNNYFSKNNKNKK